MTFVTRSICTFDNNAGSATYTFDNVSGLLQSLTINDANASGRLKITLTSRGTQTVLWTGTIPITEVTHVYDVSANNVHLIQVPGKGGTIGWQLPVDVGATWSS